MTDETQPEEKGPQEDAPENSIYLENRFLLRYPTNEFFSTTRFLTIPEGYEGVRLRFGERMNLLGMDVGGRVRPGLRFLLGLGTLWSSMAVVDVTKRTTDLEMQQVVTEGGLQLPEVDATLNWRVIDPTLAMTKATRTLDPRTGRIGYEHTTVETALARVRGYLSGRTVQELGRSDLEDRNLAYLTEEETRNHNFTDLDDDELTRKGIEFEYDTLGERQILYRPQGLKTIGTRLEELYITSIDLPDELEAAIAQREISEAEAQGQIAIAEAAKTRADKLAEAARVYEENPGALGLLYNETLLAYATSSNNTLVPLPGDISGLTRILEGFAAGPGTSGST